MAGNRFGKKPEKEESPNQDHPATDGGYAPASGFNEPEQESIAPDGGYAPAPGFNAAEESSPTPDGGYAPAPGFDAPDESSPVTDGGYAAANVETPQDSMPTHDGGYAAINYPNQPESELAEENSSAYRAIDPGSPFENSESPRSMNVAPRIHVEYDAESDDETVDIKPREPQSIKKKTSAEILAEAGFSDPVEIKSGVTGTISYFKYNGEDQQIKQLASQSDGYVLVKVQGSGDTSASMSNNTIDKIKHASLTYQNECDTINSLSGSQQHDSTRAASVVKYFGDEKTAFIVCQPIFYNQKNMRDELSRLPEFQAPFNQQINEIESVIHKKEQGIQKNLDAIRIAESKIPKNYSSPMLRRKEDRNDEATEMALFDTVMKSKREIDILTRTNIALKSEINMYKNDIKTIEEQIKGIAPSIVRNGFKNVEQYMKELGANSQQNPATTFDTVFNGMKQSQADLHRDKTIHLDTAPRNFVITESQKVSLIDLGTSQRCDDYGKTENRRFPFDPIYAYNQDALNPKDRKTDIHTDLFSMKIAMIECMAHYCGVGPQREIDKLHINGLSTNNGALTNHSDILRNNSDLARLENSTKNLIAVANNLSKEGDPRGDYVLAAVDKYRDYLISTPAKGQTLAATMAEDQAKFNACLERQPALEQESSSRFKM